MMLLDMLDEKNISKEIFALFISSSFYLFLLSPLGFFGKLFRPKRWDAGLEGNPIVGYQQGAGYRNRGRTFFSNVSGFNC